MTPAADGTDRDVDRQSRRLPHGEAACLLSLSPPKAGLLIVLAAVVWQGLGTSWVGATVPPRLSTFTTAAAFFIAAVVAGLSYLTRNRKHGRAAHPMTVREILQVNAVTTGAFGAFYVAATLIPPTAASVLETGIGPFVVAVVMGLTAGNVGRRLRQPATVLAVCLVVTGIALTVLPTHSSGGMVALGIGLTVLAGSCAVGVLLTSHALSSRGVTALWADPVS